MTEPVIESIAQAMVTQLEKIKVADGYFADATVARPARRGIWKEDASLLTDGNIIMEQGGRREPEEPGAESRSTYVQAFDLHRIVRQQDSDTTPGDTLVNRYTADMEAVLMEDWRTGGNPLQVKIVEVVPLPEEVEADGATMKVEITYRHNYGDPMTNGA